MMEQTNSVSVLVPLKAEFVSIVRLTASGIASRIGFDFDVIEDIKVSISEVLSKIIEKKLTEERIEIQFDQLEDGLSIDFKVSGNGPENLFDDEDNFAFAIISSLMDEVVMQEQDGILLTMTKKLEGAI